MPRHGKEIPADVWGYSTLGQTLRPSSGLIGPRGPSSRPSASSPSWHCCDRPPPLTRSLLLAHLVSAIY